MGPDRPARRPVWPRRRWWLVVLLIVAVVVACTSERAGHPVAAPDLVTPSTAGTTPPTTDTSTGGTSTQDTSAPETSTMDTSPEAPTGTDDTSSAQTGTGALPESSTASTSEPTSPPTTSSTIASTANSPPSIDSSGSSLPSEPGWQLDFFDDFETLSGIWGKYGYGVQKIGNGGLGRYDLDNVYTQDGHLVLATRYADGEWTGAGISSGPGFAAVQGRWEVRAKFARAVGVGYAFLLYPDDHTWPPEVDFAEGRVNGPLIEATLHYNDDNETIRHSEHVPDMTQWHTYGVIMTPTGISYTLDGQVWSHSDTTNVPTKRMWVGFQTGAHACPSRYECVADNVPDGVATPDESAIEIDWVAHYRAG